MFTANIGILGATGAVGREMLKMLDEYAIPVNELRLFASARSAGQMVMFRKSAVMVEEPSAERFKGLDFVLGAVSGSLSKALAPQIKASGAVFIDNSSAFRMDDTVPLIVPEINGEDALKHNGIIANPNCSTIISLMAIAGIAKRTKIESMVACTYQAVSGAGQGGIAELDNQMRALYEGKEPEHSCFPAQIALNVIPFIGSYTENGYTSEEMKMQNEGRKILHLPDLTVTCTCVRVPVMRSHSISITLRTAEKISVQEAGALIAAYPGCRLIEDIGGRDYPTPLDSTNQPLVYVGRIREDLTSENGLTLWCCGDQIRKGAAQNAVQILQYLMMKG